MKEYYIVAKTDGTMFIEEYERKEDGSLSDFYNKYIDGYITILNSRKLDLNIIGTILYGDYMLGNVIIGCSGYYNGEPDIVGFKNKEEATEFMKILRKYYRYHGEEKLQ